MKNDYVIDQFRERMDRITSICFIIVSSFEKEVKYDYTIPNHNIIQKMVKKIFKDNEYPHDFCQEILEIINYPASCDPYSDYDPSYLESFLLHRDNLFRDENLYGIGTWWAWRNKEDRNKYMTESYSKFNNKEKQLLTKLSKHLGEQSWAV